MQQTRLSRTVRYLAVILVMVNSLALLACSSDDEEIRAINTSLNLGASNAATAGALLQSLPPVTIEGRAFDADITGNVVVDFPTPTTFTMTGGNLPAAAGVSGNVGFGSCIFTFTTLNGFTGLSQNQAVNFTTCRVVITAGAVTVGGGDAPGTAVLVLNNFSSLTVTVTVSIADDGTLSVNGVNTNIDTDETGAVGVSG